jgi:hypothetical protein
MLASFYTAAVMIYGLIDRITLFGWMDGLRKSNTCVVCIGAIVAMQNACIGKRRINS